MRVLITGVDGHGRSCVLEEMTPSGEAFQSAGITVAVAAQTDSCPPPPRPPGHAELVSLEREPGLARWSFVQFPPRATTPFHHTDTVDFDVVLEGSVDLLLDDGPHRLGPGDGAVVKGVDHGWATHDDGCRMSVVVIGTPPLE
jgi:quercetin dioxygenase-like cupin family protein